jgi:hypothetical protein
MPEGQIRIVLTWPDAPSDLDLFSTFKTSPTTACSVFFGKKYCNGVLLNADNNHGGRKGAESITIELLEDFVYSFIAKKYDEKTENGNLKGEITVPGAPKIINKIPDKFADINFIDSKAKVSLYTSGYEFSLFDTFIPNNLARENLLFPNQDEKNLPKDINWWLAFCLDGSKGIDSIRIVNKLSSSEPKFTYCEELYNKNKNIKVENSLKENKKLKQSAFIELHYDEENRIRKVNHFLKKPERF